jgi:guanine nucleotide-binding protein G(i) subunit alpha
LADDQAVYDASKNIDKENAKDFQISSRMIKLLLLGAGECGKSTVFKQMRLLYGEVLFLIIVFLSLSDK